MWLQFRKKRTLPLFVLFMSAVCGAPLLETQAFSVRDLPAQLPCGKITDIEQTTDAVRLVSLEVALREKEFKPREELTDEELLSEEQPQENHHYVIITIQLRPGGSIGVGDYNLQASGQMYECKGMRSAKEVFDPRLWQVTAGETELNKTVELLYEVPEEAEEVALQLTYDILVAKRPVDLTPSADVEKERESEPDDSAEEAPAGAGDTEGEASEVEDKETEDTPEDQEGDGAAEPRTAQQEKSSDSGKQTETSEQEEDDSAEASAQEVDKDQEAAKDTEEEAEEAGEKGEETEEEPAATDDWF